MELSNWTAEITLDLVNNFYSRTAVRNWSNFSAIKAKFSKDRDKNIDQITFIKNGYKEENLLRNLKYLKQDLMKIMALIAITSLITILTALNQSKTFVTS